MTLAIPKLETPPVNAEIEYPESDGKPMGETQIHILAMMYLSVIFEITSKGTRFDDLASKRGLYEMLGVREYFLFDPLDEYLKPRLQGFRLRGMSYEPLTPDAEGNLFSDEMQVWLAPDDTLLRVMHPQTKTIVPTFDEAMLERKAEIERAQTEAARAARAEQEVARLRAELDALRKQQGD